MPRFDDHDQDLVDLLWGIIVVVLFVLALAVAMATAGYGQNIEGQPVASQYSTWQVAGYAPDTYTFVPTSCRVQGGASFFAAFSVGTPVTIVDGNPALTETATPSSVTINNTTCSIAIAPSNHHNLPFYLASATGGLQEAINANHANPASNTIVLDNAFYQAVGQSNVSTIIGAAEGYTNLGLVDITQTPYVWYSWNGSHYAAASTGQDVTSVFGRTGAVVAQTGDYDCAQVAGCLSSAPVQSVFGRVGAIAAQTGDYTCLQVTNCGAPPNSYLLTTLSAGISSSATTIPLTSVAGLNNAGEIVIGSEWISYTGISGDSLTGATRGVHLTTPAAYSSSTNVYSVIADFTNPSQAPNSYIVTFGNGSTQFSVFNCNSPDFSQSLVAQFNCDADGLWITTGGAIEQLSSSQRNILESEVSIGPGGGLAAITNSGYLFDSTRQNNSTVAQGFAAGIAPLVEAVQPPTIGAPTITNFAGFGSTTWSWECTGTDVDGNTFPGTVATITNGPASISEGAEIIVGCPYSAGAVTESIWRTAGPGTTGFLHTAAMPASVDDIGGSASGTPPATNSSVPKVCTNGEQYCQLSGTTSTPTVACASGTQGWTFHNVSATVSPFAYVCNGTAWVAAY